MSRMKKMIFTAVCMALCVVLPMAFHWIQNAGAVFLPMHIPVLLCGLACGWPWGLVCGLTGPALSFLLTGMPPVPVLPPMMAECAVYGLVTGLPLLHTRHPMLNLYGSMVPAMLAGRLIAGILKALIFTPGMAFWPWLAGNLLTGLPGICMQLLLVPPLLMLLQRAGLLPRR